MLVDDNPQVRSFLKSALEDSGFDCIEAVNGDDAVYQAENADPDLIVLDIELGDLGMNGLDVCKRIRDIGLKMPVIFLTVRANVEDLEHGLTVAGPGSDYVKKLEELRRMQVEGEEIGDIQVAVKAPDTHELIARIRSRLPREVQELDRDLQLDRKMSIVQRRIGEQWEDAQLQPLEFKVFKRLVDADGAVVGTWELFDKVFEGTSHLSDRPEDSEPDNYKSRVWVCVANLRKKLDPNGKHDYVQTVHGIGYRFRPQGVD